MKKVIRHVNRTLVRTLEVAGVLALLVMVAWLGLLWRLSQGPLDVSPWLTQKIEKAFSRDLAGFDFELGGAQLTWGGRFEAFEFEMRDVHIKRDDGTPVLDVQKLRVQLSKRNLVFGRIVPRVIRVYGPALRVIRQENGQFTLNVGPEQHEDEETPPTPPAADAPEERSRQELVRGVLKLLQERTGLGLLDGLSDVSVSNAALLYEDRVLDVRWLSHNADVSVSRGGSGLKAAALVTVAMEGSKKATVRADVNYDWDTQRTEARVAFTGFVPKLVAQKSKSLQQLSDIDMPFTGSLAFGLDADFFPSTARFVLGAEAGTFNLLGLYHEPVRVESIFARGLLDTAKGEAEVTELKANIGGPEVNAKMKIVTEEGGVRVATFDGVLREMPIDKAWVYWPETLAPDPRQWVTTHLSGGIAHTATIEAVAAYDTKAEEKKLSIRKLGGKITFDGIDVNYFPPLPPVLAVGGSAVYDQDSFSLDLDGGKLRDMKAGKAKVVISDLMQIGQGGHSKINIDATASGPVRTALQVLDSKPLEYPAMLGIKSAEVEGHADINVNLKFPIHKALAVKDVNVTADARLKDVLLKDVVAGMDVTGGPMDLTVSNTQLNVKGKGRLAGMPVEFDWMKNFSHDVDLTSTLKASLPLDAPALLKFGLPADFAPAGTLPVTVDYALKLDKSATLSMKGDIKTFAFSVPMIDFTKKEGAEGTVAMTLGLHNNKLQRITGLQLAGGGLSAKGDIDFVLDGMGATAVKKASFKQVVMGNTDIAVDAEPFGKSGYAVKISGRQLDASSLFKENLAPNSDAEAAKTVAPLRLDLNVARLLTGPDRVVERVKATMLRNAWKRIDQLELDAVAGKAVMLRYIPGPKGHTLKFEADDAGAALMAFGFAKSIRGGVLRIDGRPRAKGGLRDLVGTASLSDFRIKDAPVILSILKLVSIIGIPELMTSQSGVAFKKARVDFVWTDQGQPEDQKNVRLLTLKDGKTFGSSLGITFEGNIDNWKNVYDLNGTIVPASNVAKFLNIIPLVGTVLTAGGEGIFAATYKVKGTKENPEVSANPLSVLAPGILRKIFFE